MAWPRLVVLALGCALAHPALGAPRVVGCELRIQEDPEPKPTLRLVQGRVALVQPDVVLNPVAEPAEPFAWFAKTGIQVRAADAPVDLVVPVAWRRRLGILWGNGEEPPTSALRIGACAGDAWLAFPGGLYVREPACVPLVVRAGRRRTRVWIAVGRACPPRRR